MAARRWSADVVFSVTNYLPFRRLPMPTLLLEQHAGHFSPVFNQLMREKIVPMRDRLAWGSTRHWVRRSVETATVLMVQTAALADAIAATTRVPRNCIHVVPHGPGWVENRAEEKQFVRGNVETLRVGYVAKSGVNKNFTTLFRAVKKLSEQGRSLQLVLTLDLADSWTVATLAEAKAIGIDHMIENLGDVAASEIAAAYDSMDIFVFPSLCESFGIPMVEAMARGLCLVVADTPENREVAGPAGITFSALDADELAGTLGRLWDDERLRQEYALKSLTRARDFSWHSAAKGTIAALNVAARTHVN